MHSIATLAAGAAIAVGLLASNPAEAQVRVRYAPALGLTDAGNNINPSLPFRGTLTELTRIFEFLGQLYLPAGEHLDVTVLNLRMTGIRPRGGDLSAPRIVTSATPPEIKLSYVLYREARPIAGGTEFITDPNFLDTQNPKFSSGQLYYEKRILSDWFAERFKYRRGLGRIVDRQ